MPLLVQIWPAATARAPWERDGDYLILEVEAPDIASLAALLSAGRAISGTSLKTRSSGEPSVRLITRRDAVVLMPAGIARMAEWKGAALLDEAAA